MTESVNSQADGKRRAVLIAAAVIPAAAFVVALGILQSNGGDEPQKSGASSTPRSNTTSEATSQATTPESTGTEGIGPGEQPTNEPTGPSNPPAEEPTSQPATPSPLSTESQTEIPREELAPGGNARAATDLAARSDCNPDTGVSAQLNWTLAPDRGDAQRVAITQYADGFETQRFTLSPELPADATSYFWPGGLEPGGFYRWEILTLHGDIHTRSATGTFEGADCFAD